MGKKVIDIVEMFWSVNRSMQKIFKFPSPAYASSFLLLNFKIKLIPKHLRIMDILAMHNAPQV